MRSLRAAGLIFGAGMLLAGCVGDLESNGVSRRSLVPLKPETIAALEEKGMSRSSPMVVRIFKEESELEVWKPNAEGRYALFKTYPICRWSGELGPKIKEGDRQAPEGFYTITPGLMNPNSNYYLAFNMGFPNAFDRAYGRTGAHLMVHGDCSSRGCYAMTDEQIAEIYALGRESFAGGQRSFQVQAYPFRMTPANLARHRNNPHIAFWRMLKEGNDHFLLTRQEVAVSVCEKRYVFNATATEPNGRFEASGRCPTFQVPQEVADAVAEKRAKDDQQIASLIAGGRDAAPIRTGTDGGMHPTFLAKLERANATDPDRPAAVGQTFVQTPGSIPAHAVPPRAPESAVAVAAAPAAPTAQPATRVVSATPQRASGAAQGSWFSRMFRGTSDEKPAAAAATTTASSPASASAPLPPSRPAAGAPTPVARPSSAPAAAPAQGGYGLASSSSTPIRQAQAPAQAAASPPKRASSGEDGASNSSGNGLLSGAAPVLGAGSFGR